MPRKRVQRTIYLDPEQEEQLQELSKRTRVPMAEYVRDGLSLVLEREASGLKHATASARAGAR